MFEIPSDLNPALVGLAWLRGHWEGTGYREWPPEPKISYAIKLDFAENGADYFHYMSQSFEVDEDQRPIAPLDMETGFWRPRSDGTVDVMMCSPLGYSELWFGKLSPGRIDMTTDAVVRAKDAAVAYTAGRRLYGLVEGKLMFAFDRATQDQPLRSFVWATLERSDAT